MIRFIGLHLCPAPLFLISSLRLFQLYITRWSVGCKPPCLSSILTLYTLYVALYRWRLAEWFLVCSPFPLLYDAPV